MQRVTLKTSTIFIAKGSETRVFYSIGEVPKDLRRELEESTNGFNSATILIADRRGREELRRALNGMPSLLRTRLGSSLQQPDTTVPARTETPEDDSISIASMYRSFVWPLAGVSAAAVAALAWFLINRG